MWVHVPRHLSQMKKCDLRIMEIDIFIIPQIIQKSNQIIALLFIQNDYWLIMVIELSGVQFGLKSYA